MLIGVLTYGADLSFDETGIGIPIPMYRPFAYGAKTPFPWVAKLTFYKRCSHQYK